MRRLWSGAAWTAMMGIGALLAACASESQQQALDELCRYGDRGKPFLVAYYSRQGVLVSGDIDPDKWKDEQSTIPSAMARPATDLYKQKQRKDCYNEQENYWYPCTEVVEVDLSEYGTIIRGMSLDRASADAVAFCNREVREGIPKIDEQSLTSAAYRCEVVAARSCRIE